MSTEAQGTSTHAPANPLVTGTPPVNPAFQAPPTGAPGGPPVPQMVPLPFEEYQRLLGIQRTFGEFQAAQQKALETKETERLQALAQKGEGEKALEQSRSLYEAKLADTTTKYQQLEGQWLGEHKSNAINSALAGIEYSGPTPAVKAAQAAQLRAIIEAQFDTSREATGAVVVRHKLSGRPASEVIPDLLKTEEFSHFVATSHRGGSGSDATRSSSGLSNTLKPGSVQAVAAEFKARTNAHQSVGLTLPSRRL